MIAAILAPTDRHSAWRSSPTRPFRCGFRRALNVESGLNDGIATPVVTLFIAATAARNLSAIRHGA